MFSTIKNDRSTCFIIAEVGQNHQGDLDLAREYIKTFSAIGADAIKFQKRDNNHLFSGEKYMASYHSESAFADTYGLHREKLELKSEWLSILKDDCEKYGTKFMITPFDEPSLDLVCEVGVDMIKTASFDLGNLPLFSRIAEKMLPVVVSTGGGNMEQIRASVRIFENLDELAILHCVSEYPCEYNRLGLSKIELLKQEFPNHVIGLSDHFNGTLSGPVAYMMGSRVFEKHVTLNRAWKGTDHGFSLEPEGFRKFARDIRRVPEMMTPKQETELGNEEVFSKLGKSLVAFREIEKGSVISYEDLTGRIFTSQHIPVRRSNEVLGKVVKNKIEKGSIINFSDLEG